MAPRQTRVGLIGYGQIGRAVHQKIEEDSANGMEVVFVHDQIVSEATEQLPDDLFLEDLGNFAERTPDLVVEMAHPEVTRQWGTEILEKTNYMFISVTALADAELEKSIKETALRCNTRAFVPHGGVVGMDALLENRDVLEEVHVIMKKPPHNVDCANAGINPDDIKEETVLYDGPTRGICPIFPRNVNTHAAIAYAGIGFDRTHSLMIVNPEWKTAIVEIEARGPGLELRVSRNESITGVTGASTPASIYNTVQMIGSTGPGIHLR